MPNKRKFKVAVAIGNAFVLLLLIVFFLGYTTKPRVVFLTNHGNVYLEVEIAETPEERQQGLMYRERLEEDRGMLFIFEKEQPVTFWMKNTKIPLDMIFIAANGTIVEIKENVQPCVEDPCPTYPSLYPVKYVIEVNAGFCNSKGISVGNTVELQVK